jgi:hypothetical protein
VTVEGRWHTDVIAKLNVLDKFSSCNYDTGTFMATDKRKFSWLVEVSTSG